MYGSDATFGYTAGCAMGQAPFKDTPPLNPSVLTDYNRSTNKMPDETQFSPRVGFNWDIGGTQRNQLRGGLGYFTGPPPFVYLSNAFGNSGLSGYALLTCNGSTTATTSLAPPAFNAANIATPPTQCAPTGALPGATTALGAAVATIDPNFKFPKYLKGSLGYDHRFASGLVASFEGLLTTSKNNVFYQNLALVGPQYVDKFGERLRYMVYNGRLTNNVPTTVGTRNTVLDLSNSNGDKMYSLTGTLQKAFSDRLEGSVSYSYMQGRDVTTTTSSTQGSNFRFQRDVSGNLLDKFTSRSKNDMPHKIVSTGSYRLPTNTDVSFIYQGGSGAPYDYVYGAGSGTGSEMPTRMPVANDLLYVPLDTSTKSDPLHGYNAAAGSNARFQPGSGGRVHALSKVPCLRNNRGKLLTAHLPQSVGEPSRISVVSHSLRSSAILQLRLDVINFGNCSIRTGVCSILRSGNLRPALQRHDLLTQTGTCQRHDRTQSQAFTPSTRTTSAFSSQKRRRTTVCSVVAVRF